MSYLPPCIEYGVARPARGIDGLGMDASSAASICLTSLSEYGWTGSSAAGAGSLCPAIRSREVKKKPTAAPIKGMMNFIKWILSAASACTPSQKHMPMLNGMITKSTSRNLYKNSTRLILIVDNLLNIVIEITPKQALRKLR
jgi:hypothetical protein